MIQNTQASKCMAPVPEEWGHFLIDASYKFITTLSSTNSLYTVAARHSSGEVCSIKKYEGVGLDLARAKTCLREIKMLHHLRAHKNILCAYDLDLASENGRLSDVYLYSELPRSNLASLLSHKRNISKKHTEYLIYQLLCALNHIHSAGIVHGNIRPSNLLIEPDASVRLCDFTMAHSAASGPKKQPGGVGRPAVDAVVYQAPEVLLGATKKLNKLIAIDIWGVGCILAELINGTPIFDRRDLPGQIRTIIYHLGNPPDEILDRIASPQTAQNLRYQQKQKQPPAAAPSLHQYFPTANQPELNILRKTLTWDPAQRNDIGSLFEVGYFTAWRNRQDEAVCHKAFHFGFELEMKQEILNQHLIAEVNEFRTKVRQKTASNAQDIGRSLKLG
ncbi:putative mitogen-activated protein kinase MpkA [Serendipita vermifera]|nr:putative mitogen-activated protein kinase MpkA [Serendipita vermifera]